MEKFWKFAAPQLAAASAILGVTVLIIFFNGGISVGYYNHVGMLPVIRRILDSDYLPGDFGITLRFYHHREFVYLIAGLTRVMGEDRALIALSVVCTLWLSTALFCLSRALRLPVAAYLVVGLFLALNVGWTGRGFEENTFVGDREINSPTVAHAFVLLAIAALLAERYLLTALWAGLTLFFHLQIGTILTLLLAPFYALRLRQFRVPELFSFAALFFIPASFPLWHLWQMMRRGVFGSAFSIDYIEFRMPHHFELESVANAVWIAAHLLVQLAVYWWMRRARSREIRQLRMLLIMSLLLTAFSLSHVTDFYLFKNGTLIKLQFLRLSPLITLLGTLALVAAFNAWSEEHAYKGGRARSLLVYACLIVAAGAQMLHAVTASQPDYSLAVRRFVDEPSSWVKVCRWIDAHGPRDTVYLTPPGNEGFAYLANRSSVVEFKIAPDGAQYLAEWFDRLRDIAGGTLPKLRGWDNVAMLNQAFSLLRPDQLVALGAKYGAAYAVLPESSKADFEILYQNSGYRLVRLSGRDH